MDVLLQRGRFEWKPRALIDTGANLTLFDRGAGEALEVDFFDRSAPRRSVKIAGAERAVLGATVTLTLPPFDDLSWEALVWFFIEEWEASYGILGNEGFLDKWAVSFVRYAGYFVVEPTDEFLKRMPVDPYDEFQKLDAEWPPTDY